MLRWGSILCDAIYLRIMDDEVKSKVGIIVDANPESGEVNVGVDVNDDGKPDISISTVIKDKRFWMVLSIAIGAVLFTKAIGIW
jgi:hypothetical protein